MATFVYKARRRSGEEVNGTVEAVDRQSATKELRTQKLLVMSLQIEGLNSGQTDSEKDKAVLNNWRARLPITAKDRIFFCRQLAMMLNSGMTLINALDLIQLEFPKVKMRKVLSEVLIELKNGLQFSQCLQKHEKIFTPLMIKVVASAEESGEMTQSLRKISEHMEFWSEIRKKVLSACAYPTVIFIVALGIGSLMVFFIIPKFDEFLSKRGAALPWSTEFVLNISRVGISYWWAILLSIFSITSLIYLMFRHPKGRRLQERLCLKVPLIGKIILYTSMSNFATTGSLLIKSGLTVVASLKLLAGLMNIKVFHDVLAHAANKVVMGSSLKESIQNPLIPSVVNNIVAVGEETGALDEVLAELGHFYNRELQGALNTMTTMIEPILLVAVGAVVALVYFALFQAIISLMGS
ncbi:MAG: type II secretion system F family protein [Lentisphaerales bacterium]|nr:type II secretion system F family protein [Lentisphaerales bacterium]